MPDGKEICFAGGFFDSGSVENQELRALAERELDKIANVPASHIYTVETAPMAKEEKEVVQEILGSATTGFDQVNKVPAGTQTHAMPSQTDQKPTLNPQHSQVSDAAASASVAAGHPGNKGGSGSVADNLAKARAAIANSGSSGTAAPSNSSHTPHQPAK